MQSAKSAITPLVAGLIVIIIVLGASFAYYYSTGPSSQVSSLNSRVSSLEGVVSSQSSEISSLQSLSASTSTVTVTSSTETTVTSTVSGGGTVTVRTTLTGTTTITFGGTDYFMISGNLTVTGANGSGVLGLSVVDEGSDVITGISVTIPTGADPTSDLCTSTCNIQIVYLGGQVSTANPLPSSATASGTTAIDESQSGDSYGISVTVTFGDATSATQTTSVASGP